MVANMTVEQRVIFDSGTTSHILSSNVGMSKYRVRGGVVRLGDQNKQLAIVGTGDTDLCKGVLHVPDMSYGLLSISKFDDEGHITIFRNQRCWVVSSSGQLVCSGTRLGNLYFLDKKYCTLMFTSSESSTDETEVQFAALVKRLASTQLGYNDLELLHQRWAHANEQSIKRAVREGKITGCDCDYGKIKDQRLRFCDKCWQGHMRSFGHDPISKQVWAILEKIGIDYKGPFPKRTPEGYVGFFVFSDQTSNFTKIYMVKSQRALLWCLKHFLHTVVEPTGHTWRLVQADQAKAHKRVSVLDWLIKHYIRIQYSAPYKHSQNGMVERDIGFIMDRARTVMAQYNTPPQYWGWAVQYASYTINRTHVPQSTGKTAYEMVYKKLPNVSNLVPFYAPGVYHLTKEERKGKSWEWKAEPCRMLGYSEDGKNSYIVQNVRTGRVVRDRADCIFDESFHQVLRENQKNPNSQLIYELFEQFEHYPPVDTPEPIWHERITADQWQGKLAESKASDLHPDTDPKEFDSDPDVTDSETDSDNLALFPDTSETDFDGDFIGIEQDCDDWRVASAAALDLPPLPPAPDNIEEALAGPDSKLWHAAIMKELEMMEKLKVMDVAQEQHGPGMKMKMILRTTYNNDFTIKHKARLVICGYSQVRGRDYEETYSPTIAVLVILLVMHVAAFAQMFGGSFDVASAFLNAVNDFANFGYLPKGLFGRPLRMRILKAMYGEKQAPKLWSDMLHKILLQLGFDRCPFSACLYYYSNGASVVFLTVHVDDGLLFVSHEHLFEQFITKIQEHLPKVSLTRPLQKYVGIEVAYDRSAQRVELSQKLFSEELLSDANRQEDIPMCPSYNLRTEPPNPLNDSLLHITGKLRYLCDRTRHDLLLATGEISKGGAESPSDLHVRTAMKTLRFAKVTAGRALVLGSSTLPKLFAFTDASYHGDGNSKSRLGGCLFLSPHCGAFNCFSKSSTLVTQSSTHAELLALYETVNLVVHCRQILDFIKHPQLEATRIYCDSQPSIQLCSLLKMTHKTSSINMRVHYIRQCLNSRLISLHFIPTALNIADVLTKPLPAELFDAHSSKLQQGFQDTDLEEYTQHTNLVLDSLECDSTMCLCCYNSSSLFIPHMQD
jgi:hypothetical protein